MQVDNNYIKVKLGNICADRYFYYLSQHKDVLINDLLSGMQQFKWLDEIADFKLSLEPTYLDNIFDYSIFIYVRAHDYTFCKLKFTKFTRIT